jgi:hypothetical protein
MLDLSSVIAEAFRYTRDHRKLWILGIFLSWVTMLNLAKFFGVSVSSLPFFSSGLRHAAHLAVHSGDSKYTALVLVFAAVSILIITVARVCLINAAQLLHRGEKELNYRKVLSQSVQEFWPVFAAGIALNVLLAVLAVLLFGPALATLHFGYAYRGALLFAAAAILFVPAWVFLTLVNIFASNFMVVYRLPFRRAVPAAVDLFARHWEQAVALVAAIGVVYVLVFFMSAGALGFVSALAYALVVLVKSLTVHVVAVHAAGVSAGVAAVFFFVVTVALVLVAAVIAVFTSIAWTIFFLESIGAVKSGDAAVVLAAGVA